jgi:ribosomal-protein-alanine N-acetyltransferase
MLPRLPLPVGVLRPWCAADADVLPTIANDWQIARNLTERFPHPYTAADADAWIGLNTEDPPPLLAFAIEVDGRLAGGCGLEPGSDVHRRTAKLGYWLARACWGRGIATAAASTLARWAFAEQPFVRLEAMVFAWNPASMRVLEKSGFQREGVLRSSVERDGSIIDAVMYARVRSPQ